jgi:hypothetical protein
MIGGRRTLFIEEVVMKTKAFALVLTALIFGSLTSIATAKSHTQNISKQSALALCSGHGGGTECGFCHGGHCHAVTCGNKGGKCQNVVVDQIKAKPGNGHTKVTTVKGGNGDDGPKRHPINVAAPVKPVSVKSPVASPTSGHGGMNQSSHRH